MDERDTEMKKQIIFMLAMSIVFGSFTFAQSKKSPKRAKPVPTVKDTSANVSKLLVTFVELGSVKCIPCKAMQPVMASIEKKYKLKIPEEYLGKVATLSSLIDITKNFMNEE